MLVNQDFKGVPGQVLPRQIWPFPSDCAILDEWPERSHEVAHDDRCRLALQGGTRPSLNFNGLAETEMPLWAFQLGVRQAFWALKLRRVLSISGRAFSRA